MPDLRQRSAQPELMDLPDAPQKELWQNLRELEVVNKYLGGYGVIFAALKQLQLPPSCSIMDLGSGGGDTLRAIAGWMRRNGKRGTLTGVDYNPVMIGYAQQHAAHNAAITYKELDIFDEALSGHQADVVMCSLFCHHFKHNDLVRLVQRMQEMAGRAVVINDLHRHWLAYYSIKAITAVFSKTYMVKHDAPLSVARAFTRRDWEQVMSDAGIARYRLRWKWAFRWLLIIDKQAG